jgi:DNA polymerase-3 subunit beta
MAGETGETTSKVSAETEGEGLEIAFNVKYVSDVLSVIQSDAIDLEFNDDASAGAIKSPNDKNFIYIVMPLKTDS